MNKLIELVADPASELPADARSVLVVIADSVSWRQRSRTRFSMQGWSVMGPSTPFS